MMETCADDATIASESRALRRAKRPAPVSATSSSNHLGRGTTPAKMNGVSSTMNEGMNGSTSDSYHFREEKKTSIDHHISEPKQQQEEEDASLPPLATSPDGHNDGDDHQVDEEQDAPQSIHRSGFRTESTEDAERGRIWTDDRRQLQGNGNDVRWDESQLEHHSHERSVSINHAEDTNSERSPDVAKPDENSDPSLPYRIPQNHVTPGSLAMYHQRHSLMSRQSSNNTMRLLEEIDDLDSSSCESEENSESCSRSVLTSSLSSVVSNPDDEGSRRQSALTPRSSLIGRPSLALTDGGMDDDDSDATSNQDPLAKILSATMAIKGIEIGHKLAERASCIESIKWLGQHLPESVVALLIDEIEDEEAELEDKEESGYFSPSPSKDTSTRIRDPGSEVAIVGSTIDDTDDGEARAVLRGRLGSLDTEVCHIPGMLSGDNTYNEAEGDSSASMEGSLSVPLHCRGHDQDYGRESKDCAMLRRRPRRHSLFGGMMGSSNTYEADLAEPGTNGAARHTPQPRQRMARRASMPGGLIVRSLEASTHSIGAPRRDSLNSLSGRRDSFTSYGERDFLNSADEDNDAQMQQNLFSHADPYDLEDGDQDCRYLQQHGDEGHDSASDQHGVTQQHGSYGSAEAKVSATATAESRPSDHYYDPSPSESVSEKDDNYEEHEEQTRDQWKKRTRDSILKLGSEPLLEYQDDDESYSDGDGDEPENFYFTDVIPPATRHDCSLLFVDISGFTKLSTTLGVEALSKTINKYFQMIVEEVEDFGGDVLKFAGDALFAEWQATTTNYPDTGSGDGMSLGGASQSSIEPWHGLSTEECVLTASACAARIVDKCSDYPVYADGGNRGQKVTELNVHCGVGFGEVVGVHVGDNETRMEYLILGDPIEQVAEAIDMASRGEVVASPEALLILEETAEVDPSILESDTDKPQIIATKSSCFFKPRGTAHVRRDWKVTFEDVTIKPRERLAKRCVDWTFDALKRLRHRMELYVHPVVANEESAPMKVYPGDRSRAQELRHRSEAELRDVFTVFIMPLITARLTGNDETDCKVLVLLNDIMLIMTRELARFKGQLRQFIVDDKGVVLIANFGLRGSTFPNMIAKRALPFMSTVQTLLQGELSTDCQMGATYGKAYCGVVGGVARHEYAVLGPSVNLAARLMANPANKGMLVDFSVKEKAGGRQFRALPPVKAKGYPELVPIFEPMQTDKGWTNISGRFVGRETELAQLGEISDDIVGKGGPSKFIMLTGETGAGKTALCVQATKNITDKCAMRPIPHLLLKNIFNEGDLFVPFSIARPIFTEIIKSVVESDGNYAPQPGNVLEEWSDPGSDNSIERVRALSTLMQLCENADVPSQYTDIIGKLILTRGRADIADGQATASTRAQLHSIAQYLVKAFLQCTMRFDLVVLALDDISNMDENSWEVVELLMEHSHNLMIIGTTRPITRQSMHVDEGFWDKLYGDYTDSGKFLEIDIAPMPKSDLDVLIAMGRSEAAEGMTQNQPRGMPSIASEFITTLYPKEMTDFSENTSLNNTDSDLDVGNIGELVLHTIDDLSPTARTHLNLAAILGTQFDLMDVVIVFEQYRGIQADERYGHAESVHESLLEAVRRKILAPESDELQNRYSGPSDHPYAAKNVSYKFAHEVWRSNILRLTLDEWKRNMHSLIAQSMETVMNSEFADDYLQLTKLFAHWKESGSAEKAATLALRMGRSLENVGLTRQGLVVYHEALDMWKARDYDTSLGDEAVGGLSMQLLEQLEAKDIEHIIRLNVALGRCYTNILDPRESIRAFQTALNLLHKAPSSVDLVDKSIIFPVLSGLFVALRFGHNEDPQYEQGLVRMFLRETKFYNDFHYCRALAMKAEMLGRHGEFEKAIQTTIELQESYDVDEFSEQISLAYGSDQSAQCISHSAQWFMCLGAPTAATAAVSVCDYVLAELLPRMDTQNVQATFQMLYPVLWVLKDNGRAQQAKDVFNELVVGTSMSRLDERGITSDKPLHFPIIALLDMVATDGSTEKLDSYVEWFMIDKNGRFSSELNFTMGSAGRTADTITAEMCLLLAKQATGRAERTCFTRKGYELARDAVELTREKEDSRGMIVAHMHAKPILNELEEMRRTLPMSRRFSMGW